MENMRTIENLSEETKRLISELLPGSFEGTHLGLECDEQFISNVVQGKEISTDLARDNVFIYGGFDVLYIEENEQAIMIKDGLTDDEVVQAGKQLDAYLKELSFIRMVNVKIKEIHKLIREGVLS